MLHDYKMILREALKKADAEGRSIRRTFNKTQFVEQFPDAAKDPRFQLLPDTFIFNISPLISISAGELEEICNESPDKLLAASKLKQLIGLGADTIVVILREEMIALQKSVESVIIPTTPDKKNTEPEEKPEAQTEGKPLTYLPKKNQPHPKNADGTNPTV